MFSRVASASRRSAEPVAVQSSSYRAFRRRFCSSRSLRDCSAAIVKTVDMEFSFVVLAAPTIGAACGPEVTISSRRPPHGREARTKGKKEKSSHAASIAKTARLQRSAKKIPEGTRAQKKRACNGGASKAFRQFVLALTFTQRKPSISKQCIRSYPAVFLKHRCGAATAIFN